MTAKTIEIKSTVEMTSENKCSFCTASICCTYTTEQLETPRSIVDFDHILWQISHENIQVYKDEDGWFLLINNKCSHLKPGGGCGIYAQRPMVCREYSNDHCEYDESATEGFELFFEDYNALLKYCNKRFKTFSKRFSKV